MESYTSWMVVQFTGQGWAMDKRELRPAARATLCPELGVIVRERTIGPTLYSREWEGAGGIALEHPHVFLFSRRCGSGLSSPSRARAAGCVAPPTHRLRLPAGAPASLPDLSQRDSGVRSSHLPNLRESSSFPGASFGSCWATRCESHCSHRTIPCRSLSASASLLRVAGRAEGSSRLARAWVR